MTQAKAVIPIEIEAADLADLQAWARDRGEPLDALLKEALQQYLRYTRDDHEDLRRRMAGPWYEHDEAMRILAERRRQRRAQAAE